MIAKRPLSCSLLIVVVLAACNADKPVTPKAEVTPPSAIGNEVPIWIAVSPAYLKTGFVLATSDRLHECVESLLDCVNRLWVTHDGGATWRRPKVANFRPSQPVIGVDSSGHETIFSIGESDLQRSDDKGETWGKAGPKGFPTPLPTYGSDGMVAVAGATDYLLNAGTGVTQTVAGSGGVLDDRAFAFATGFPNTGSYPPAWLVGLDKQTGRVIVQQCDAQLTCSGLSIFPGTVKYRGTVPTFHPSAEYSKDGVVFVQARQSMYKSTDGGITFKPLTIVDHASTKSTVWMIAVDPNYSEAGPIRSAYSAFVEQFTGGGQMPNTAGGLYRTINGGESWRKVGSNAFDKGATAVVKAPDGRFFAGFVQGRVGWEGGLLCSIDGKKWEASCPPVGARWGSK